MRSRLKAYQGPCRWQTGSRGLITSLDDWPDAFKGCPSGQHAPPPAITARFGAAPPSASVERLRNPTKASRRQSSGYSAGNVRPSPSPGYQAHGHAAPDLLKKQFPSRGALARQSQRLRLTLSPRVPPPSSNRASSSDTKGLLPNLANFFGKSLRRALTNRAIYLST